MTAAARLLPVHLALTLLYVARQVWLRMQGRPVSPGKDLVIATTWLTWYVGIVVLDSDYAFTVTNVLVHGIPYLALVWRYGRGRFRGTAGALGRVFHAREWPLFLATLVAAAWLEEWGWDRFVARAAGLFPARHPASAAARWPSSCPSWRCPRRPTTCSTPGSGAGRAIRGSRTGWASTRAASSYPNRSSANGSPRMWYPARSQ